MKMEQIAYKVKEASLQLAIIYSKIKNEALLSIAKALLERKKEIIVANQTEKCICLLNGIRLSIKVDALVTNRA